jgi:hypothetical protein
MPEIAPKEQVLPTDGQDYVLFRSTLESRWAMAFELLKINWHYEPNRFPLPTGSYLPDFFLPEIGWIEIKPTFKALKESEPKLATFARHKSNLLEENLPFYSINSSYPTFHLPERGTNPLLLEWMPGTIQRRGRDYAIDTFRSQDKLALYEEARDQYVDFADRAMSMAQDAHIDEPLPIGAVLALAIRSLPDGGSSDKRIHADTNAKL